MAHLKQVQRFAGEQTAYCAQVVIDVQGETQYINYRVLQRQLKLEEDTGVIDPYTQHWIPE